READPGRPLVVEREGGKRPGLGVETLKRLLIVADTGVDRQGGDDSPLILQVRAVALGRRVERRIRNDLEVVRGAVGQQVVLKEVVRRLAGVLREERRLGEVAVARVARALRRVLGWADAPALAAGEVGRTERVVLLVVAARLDLVILDVG